MTNHLISKPHLTLEAIVTQEDESIVTTAILASDEHWKNGEFDKAITLLSDASVKVPTSAALHTYLGKNFRDQGNKDQAIHHCRLGTQLSPHSCIASLSLYVALNAFAEYCDALDEAERFIRLHPDSDCYDEVLDDLDPSRKNRVKREKKGKRNMSDFPTL